MLTKIAMYDDCWLKPHDADFVWKKFVFKITSTPNKLTRSIKLSRYKSIRSICLFNQIVSLPSLKIAFATNRNSLFQSKHCLSVVRAFLFPLYWDNVPIFATILLFTIYFQAVPSPHRNQFLRYQYCNCCLQTFSKLSVRDLFLIIFFAF